MALSGVALDLPAVRQCSDDVVGRDIVVRIEAAFESGRAVDPVMRDDEEHASGCHERGKRELDRLFFGLTKSGVESAHKVEETRCEARFEQAGVNPLDVAGDLLSPGFRRVTPTSESALGDVERRHPPAALGEPHGVAALAAAHVERAPDGKIGKLALHRGDERNVRVAAPDLLLAVDLVPVLVVGAVSVRGVHSSILTQSPSLTTSAVTPRNP